MSSIPLTLAEAVPLGTVLLQRLLDDAGIRSLVIKGPAFVELGVRKPKQSNDIDLLIHPDDRPASHERLVAAGGRKVSSWLPSELDDVIHSTTWRHPSYPVTVDLHHGFAGVLTGAEAFNVLWNSRTAVSIGHSEVPSPGREHALVLEALNRFKSFPLEEGDSLARRVVASAAGCDLAAVAAAAASMGAEHTAAPLIRALGGRSPESAPNRRYRAWVQDAGRSSRTVIWYRLMMRAPHHLPRMLWMMVLPHGEASRHWADIHGKEYRGRVVTLAQRVGVQWQRMRERLG